MRASSIKTWSAQGGLTPFTSSSVSRRADEALMESATPWTFPLPVLASSKRESSLSSISRSFTMYVAPVRKRSPAAAVESAIARLRADPARFPPLDRRRSILTLPLPAAANAAPMAAADEEGAFSNPLRRNKVTGTPSRLSSSLSPVPVVSGVTTRPSNLFPGDRYLPEQEKAANSFARAPALYSSFRRPAPALFEYTGTEPEKISRVTLPGPKPATATRPTFPLPFSWKRALSIEACQKVALDG